MITTRRHLEIMLDADRRHRAELRQADQEAVRVLADNFERRMNNTNEWRAVVENQQKGFVTKSAAYSALVTIIAVLGVLVAYYATLGGH